MLAYHMNAKTALVSAKTFIDGPFLFNDLNKTILFEDHSLNEIASWMIEHENKVGEYDSFAWINNHVTPKEMLKLNDLLFGVIIYATLAEAIQGLAELEFMLIEAEKMYITTNNTIHADDVSNLTVTTALWLNDVLRHYTSGTPEI